MRLPTPLLLASSLIVLAACSPQPGAAPAHTEESAQAGQDTAQPAAPAETAPAATPASGPQASPRDTARGTVGGAQVLIDYGRPSKRGREIFGGLVPYGRVWRTGANSATTLVTDRDLTIGGTAVPAGTYTIYTLPERERWQLVVNRQTGQWGTEYNQEQDLARIPMQVRQAAQPVEQFEVAFVPGESGGQVLELRWDTTVASVPVTAGR